MSIIHIADDKQGSIIDFITAKNIIDDAHKKSLENTLETYQFITFADKRYSEFLEKRNRIIIPDEDGTLREFVIAEAVKYKDSEGHKQQIFARASYLELKKASVLYPNIFTGSASQHVGRTLNNTIWRVGIIESPASRQLQMEIDNHTNPYTFLGRIAREFGLELRFRVEHDGNRITARYVDLLERRGEWRGRTVEFGKDLDGIRRIEKQDIVTALLGLGPEDEDGNRLEVLVEDEEALQRWGTLDDDGNLQHLIEPYEIQSDRTEMTEEEARRYTRTALDKRIDTQISYETTIIDLENVPGMQNKKIRFGDTIRIKDTKFNPPLFLEARIFEQTRSIKSKAKKDIKLGDFVEFTEEEVHSEFEQMRKEIRSRITRSEMLQYTYDKLTIDNKDEETYEEGKQFAEAVGVDAKGHADIVAGEAEESSKEYADDVSSQAYQDAIAYAVAEEIYNQKMQEIALELEDKVEYEYIDGQLELKVDSSVVQSIQNTVDDLVNTRADLIQDIIDLESDIENKLDVSIYNQKILDIESDISDKADGEWVDGRLSSKADADSVYTISQIDNRLNNYVGLSTYKTDKDGYVDRFESAESRISQTEDEIATTVKQSDFEALENEVGGYGGRLTEAESNISQNASAIQSRVTQTDFNSLTGRVSSAESSITQQAGLIEQRVTKTEYDQDIDGIVTDISSNESRITQTESDISSAVKRTEFEQLEDDFGNFGTRLGTAETSIGQNATAISQRATKTEFNSLTGRVSTAEGSITTMAGQISLKANQSDLDTVTGEVSTLSGEISTMAGEISLKAERSVVEGLRTDFDNLEIGGRNLILNGDFSQGLKNWRRTNNTIEIDNGYSGNGLRINITTTGTVTPRQRLNIRLEAGDTITAQVKVKTISGDFSSMVLRVASQETIPFKESKKIDDDWTLYVYQLTKSSPIDLTNEIGFYRTTGEYIIDDFKLEKGNKATDWTPAPEDIEAQFDTVTSDISELVVDVNGISGTVSSLSQTVGTHGTNISNLTSQLNVQAGLIEGKVDSTTYNTGINGVINDIKSHNTRISQNASAINLRATKTEVDNLAGEVSSNTAQLSVQAGQISSKVSQTEFDNLEIGGRNLLEGTSSEWTTASHSRYYASLKGRLYLNDLDLEVGDTITLRMYVKTGSVAGARARIRYHDHSGSNHGSHLGTQIGKNTEGWIEVTSKIPSNTRDFFVAINAQDNGTSTGTFQYKYLKLEKGNRATDWTPAPEDIDAELSSHKTSIDQNAEDITLRATKSEVNTLTGRVSSAETNISTNAEAIGLRATKNEVDAISGRLSTAEASIEVMPDEIDLRVEQGIGSLEIGGRNYFSLTHLNSLSTGGFSVTGYVYNFSLEPNTEYTLSTNLPRGQNALYFNGSSSDSRNVYVGKPLTMSTDKNGEFYIAVTAVGRNYEEEIMNGEYWVQLEKGNKATDWSPAPEDLQNIGGNNLISHDPSKWTNFGDFHHPATPIDIEPNTTYTLTAYFDYSSSNIAEVFLALNQDNFDNIRNFHLYGNGENRKSVTFTTNSDEKSLLPIIANSDSNFYNRLGDYYRVKLEKGTVSTDWSVSSEDTVRSDNIISSINLTQETATISAENIELVGAVNVLSDITGNLGSITAGDITGVDIKGATITQEGTEGSITLNNEGFFFESEHGSIRMATSEALYGYDNSASIKFSADGFGEMVILQDQSSSVISTDSYLSLITPNVSIHEDASLPGKLEFYGTGVNHGIQIGFGNQSHVITKHNTNSYFVIYPQRYSGQDVFRIRSHHQKSSYRDDFRLNIRGEIISVPTKDNAVTWGGRAAVGASSGRFGFVSSASKYKLLIEDVDVDPYNILELNPKSWYDKNNTEEYAEILERQRNGEDVEMDVEKIERIGGLIAEDVDEAGLSLYVNYNADGEVEGVDYDRIWTLLIPISRDHEMKIFELEQEMEWLKTENQLLINEIKKIKEQIS